MEEIYDSRNQEILSKNQGKILKGIMAIGIILHHLTLEYNCNLILLKPFKYIGFLCVGLFFFISGYGLTVSMITKKDYLNNSRNRIVKVLFPFAFAVLIYTLYYFILKEIKHKNIFFIVKYSWYIYEIIVLYILFFTIYKQINFKLATIIITIIILISLGIIYINGGNSTYYKSTLAFVVGIFVGRYSENLHKYINNMNKVKILNLIFITTISLILGKYFDLKVFEILIYNISTTLFIFVVLVILNEHKKLRNNVLEKIGNISFEIYLYHGLIIDLFLKLSVNKNIGSILILITTIVVAYIINKIDIVAVSYITKIGRKG